MDSSDNVKSKTAIVIHGGAGTILKSKMTPEIEQAYIEALTHALKTGHKILQEGGSSTEAVKATIVTMEDSPLFNAGKGAVFTHEGKNELDASIMSAVIDQLAPLLESAILRTPFCWRIKFVPIPNMC